MILKLNDCGPYNANKLGSKGHTLYWLLQEGYKVPVTYILPTEALDTFLNYREGNETFLQSSFKETFDAFQYEFWPSELYTQLKDFFEVLKTQCLLPCIVRSSAACEDGIKQSYAGIFHSELFVTSFSDFIKAILKCWASAKVQPVDENATSMDNSFHSMALVIQPMINADISGVLFTCDPVQNDFSKAVMEIQKGLAVNIVDGTKNCQLYYFDIINEKITFKFNNLKPFLTEEIAYNIFKTGIAIHQKKSWPQDIEWSIEKESQDLILLQSRPVTSIQEPNLLYSCLT